MASISSTHCRLERSSCENRRKFSSDSAAWLASACNTRFSSSENGAFLRIRHSVPSRSPSLAAMETKATVGWSASTGCVTCRFAGSARNSRSDPRFAGRGNQPAAAFVRKKRLQSAGFRKNRFRGREIPAPRPSGVQHARRALREALQKFRQLTRLRRVDGKLHQFVGVAHRDESDDVQPCPRGVQGDSQIWTSFHASGFRGTACVST